MRTSSSGPRFILGRSVAEWSLVLALLRGDETPEAAVDRVDSLSPRPALADVGDRKARKLLSLIYSNAARDRATSVRLAASTIGLAEDILLDKLEKVDPDAVQTYAEVVIDYGHGQEIAELASEAEGLAKAGRSEEALDKLSEKLGALELARQDDSIMSVPEATAYFLKWYQHFQSEMKSGKKRFSLLFDSLDEMVPYIFPGHAVLVSGKSKMGKSSFCQMLFDYNIQRGLRGLYFHFEDTTEEMGMKRTAREMAGVKHADGSYAGLSLSKLLHDVATPQQLELISEVNSEIMKWHTDSQQVSSAGWTMSQVLRVIHAKRKQLDFFIVDYIGKARLTPRSLRDRGLWMARAEDAEQLKNIAQKNKLVAVVVQQEHGGESGRLYGSKAAWQKFQVWLSLAREELPTGGFSSTPRSLIGKTHPPDGTITVKAANVGQTGQINAWFYHDFVKWAAR